MGRTQANTVVGWISLFFATTGFSGFIPSILTGRQGHGGGVAGSVLALILGAILLNATAWWITAFAAMSLVVGILVVGHAETLLASWGSRPRHTGEIVTADFNETNIDEFHGQLMALIPVWFVTEELGYRIIFAILSFVAFRLFDVMKVGPVRYMEERLPTHGLRIMLDDTVAGLMAGACVLFLALITN